MTKIVKRVAFVALCATALTAVGHSANAASISIGGVPLASAPTPLYGGVVTSNNVVNSPGAPLTGSALNDPTGPNLTAATPWIQNGQVTTTFTSYRVDWFFIGAESGLVNTLTATSVTPGSFSYTENNQNNSAYAGGPPAVGPATAIGSTFGLTSVIQFQISWLPGGPNPGGVVTNDSTQSSPGTGLANMIFSFLDLSGPCTFTVAGCNITNDPNKSGDWFVFALNDSGGPDDNHDDFVGVAHVVFVPPDQFPTPVPAALPLFASAIGGGFAFSKWRKRRKAQAQAA
jgi:hypothetical protein